MNIRRSWKWNLWCGTLCLLCHKQTNTLNFHFRNKKRKLHVNLHMKFCLQFQKGHTFSHRIRIAIYILTLVTSCPPRGEVIIYMLIIPKSLSLVQISLLGHCSHLSRCTRTPQIPETQVVWSQNTIFFHLYSTLLPESPVLVNGTGTQTRMP